MTKNTANQGFILSLLAMGLVACGQSSDKTAAGQTSNHHHNTAKTAHCTDSQSSPVYIQTGWVRAAAHERPITAAYLTICNQANADILEKAVSKAANTIEFHQSNRTPEGVVSMAQVENVPLPANGPLIMEPGGYHLMLIGLQQPLGTDMSVEIELHFRKAGIVTATLPVKRGEHDSSGADHATMKH